MKRFGPDWGAPICHDLEVTPTPVGTPCEWCGEAIEDGDSGVIMSGGPYHWECNTRMVIGGANHIRKTCTCYGGTEPNDPPDLTLRQSAQLAVHLFEQGTRGGTP